MPAMRHTWPTVNWRSSTRSATLTADSRSDCLIIWCALHGVLVSPAKRRRIAFKTYVGGAGRILEPLLGVVAPDLTQGSDALRRSHDVVVGRVEADRRILVADAHQLERAATQTQR